MRNQGVSTAPAAEPTDAGGHGGAPGATHEAQRQEGHQETQATDQPPQSFNSTSKAFLQDINLYINLYIPSLTYLLTYLRTYVLTSYLILSSDVFRRRWRLSSMSSMRQRQGAPEDQEAQDGARQSYGPRQQREPRGLNLL